MTYETFEFLIKQISDKSNNTLFEKNAGYSSDADAIHHFVAGARAIGRTPAQTALGYATKHWVALVDKVERDDFSNKEDLMEKIQDLINYLRLIWVIANDDTCTVTLDEPAPGTAFGKLRDKK